MVSYCHRYIKLQPGLLDLDVDPAKTVSTITWHDKLAPYAARALTWELDLEGYVHCFSAPPLHGGNSFG